MTGTASACPKLILKPESPCPTLLRAPTSHAVARSVATLPWRAQPRPVVPASATATPAASPRVTSPTAASRPNRVAPPGGAVKPEAEREPSPHLANADLQG